MEAGLLKGSFFQGVVSHKVWVQNCCYLLIKNAIFFLDLWKSEHISTHTLPYGLEIKLPLNMNTPFLLVRYQGKKKGKFFA